MTDSFEHDTEEEARERTDAKPLPDEPEPHRRALEREAMKEVMGHDERPWNHPDNPLIWAMISGEPFDDYDDEEPPARDR